MWLWNQNFQFFFCIDSASMKSPLFGIFWALNPSNIVWSCWNFDQNGMQLTFTVWVHIGAQFTVGKPKILLKTKTSAKTASLGMINNISPRSQKNQKSFVKLSQKNFSRPKLGLNYHYGSRGHHKFSHSLY